MRIEIITIFPKQVQGFLSDAIFSIAKERGVEITVHNLRDWTKDKHKTVDDRPYGGGPGMVMMVEPIYQAVKEIQKGKGSKVILTSASGSQWTQKKAKECSSCDQVILVCGHYEGVDHRVVELLNAEEVSIGPYVLSGGELPSLVIADSLVRLQPGVLGNKESLAEESHEDGLLEYPQYTRPAEFKGAKVPEVLLSGNHGEIQRWRKSRFKPQGA